MSKKFDLCFTALLLALSIVGWIWAFVAGFGHHEWAKAAFLLVLSIDFEWAAHRRLK